MTSPLQDTLLYAIIDLGYLQPDKITQATRELLAGGAGIVQLRAKGHRKEDILNWAQQIAPICRAARVPFVVNDFIDIARACDANGVHLGQDDGPLSAAREQLAPGKLVGRSTHSPEQAAAALAEGADYIGFGPLFPTPTKKGRPGIGLENIAEVEAGIGSRIPVFCIGGIKDSNLATVRAHGGRRVVVVSGLLQSEDISRATSKILASLQEEI